MLLVSQGLPNTIENYSTRNLGASEAHRNTSYKYVPVSLSFGRRTWLHRSEIAGTTTVVPIGIQDEAIVGVQPGTRRNISPCAHLHTHSHFTLYPNGVRLHGSRHPLACAITKTLKSMLDVPN